VHAPVLLRKQQHKATAGADFLRSMGLHPTRPERQVFHKSMARNAQLLARQLSATVHMPPMSWMARSNGAQVDELTLALGLHSIRNHDWHIQVWPAHSCCSWVRFPCRSPQPSSHPFGSAQCKRSWVHQHLTHPSSNSVPRCTSSRGPHYAHRASSRGPHKAHHASSRGPHEARRQRS